MTPRREESGGGMTEPQAPLPPTASSAAAAAAADAADAVAAAAAPTEPLITERAFDVTLKNNDNPNQTQTVVARGVDGGLAAQAAMRQRPGWTADHSKTQEHEG